MYRTWIERELESKLSERRREQARGERRKRKRREAAKRANERWGPRRRAIAGEVIEDVFAAVWGKVS